MREREDAAGLSTEEFVDPAFQMSLMVLEAAGDGAIFVQTHQGGDSHQLESLVSPPGMAWIAPRRPVPDIGPNEGDVAGEGLQFPVDDRLSPHAI